MTGRPDWRSRSLLATTVVAIALAATVAFLTIDAPPLPARRAKAPTVVTAQIAPPPPAIEFKLPTAEAPPAPSTSEFTAKPAEPPAAPTTAPAPPPAPAPSTGTSESTDLASLPIEEVRSRATANDVAAMEEIARRLIQGIGVAKDPKPVPVGCCARPKRARRRRPSMSA